LKTLTYAQALNEAILEEMERDSSVFCLGEDIGLLGGAFQVTRGLMDIYGQQRVRNTPISEQAIAGIATGAAMKGLRPIAEFMYIDFMGLAIDQIVNQAAKARYMSGGKIKVPLVFRTQGGSGRGNAAQHSQSLEAWYYHIPGLKVIMPSNPHDAKGLLKSAIRDDNPVIFIEHKLLYSTKGDLPEMEYTIPIGTSDIKRTGKDLTLIAASRMVSIAILAAERLKNDYDIEVIDLRTLVPLDMQAILKSVKKTGRVILIQEAIRRGGVASDISSNIIEKAFDFLEGPIKIIAGRNTVIPYSQILESIAVPGVEEVEKGIKDYFRHL
jgi:pyruvate/2-oxoglutarate/acetoin dehydrogenase E1 component